MAKRGTLDNPKTKRLARALRTCPGVALGILETLWHWVGEFRRDGGMTRIDVEDALDSGGWLSMFKADDVVEALVESEHFRCGPPFLQVCDLDDVLGQLRLEDGLNKRQRRWRRLKAAGGSISAAVRAIVFAQSDNQCLHCGSSSDLTVDHVRPISAGGTNELTNLQTLCRRCNSRKKDKVISVG